MTFHGFGRSPILAADRLQQAINDITDPARGWVREQKAAYLHFTDSATAQQQLGAAIRDNPMVLHPAVGVDVRQARPPAVQARAAAEYLGTTYADSTALVLGLRAVLDDIVWDKNRAEQAEDAWEKLGLHLGFDSMRPERISGTGPDNLWILSSIRHAVIELKTSCELDSAQAGWCTGALISSFSPRIGLSRDFSRPRSASMGLLAYCPRICRVAGTSSSITHG